MKMIIIEYKYRPIIIQSQIDDFIGYISLEKYNMYDPKDYRNARKKFLWLSVQKRNSKKSDLPGDQTKMHEFINWKPILTGKYLYRFFKIRQTIYEDFAEGKISKKEWDMIHLLPKYDGAFENLFELNSIDYFDKIQERLELEGVKFNGKFIKDIIIFELLRKNLGFKDFRGIEKIHRFSPILPIFGLPVHKGEVPTAADMSTILKKIPARDMYNYFQLLVEECIEYGIIVPRILMWDGQFIKANSNNNRKEDTNEFGDPDAGYCRHNGKKKGVGYDPGILYAYCRNRWFPIYFKMYPGNRNDSKAFSGTIRDFLKINKHKWDVLLSDSGPYSLKNLEYVRECGILPIIRSRKGIKNQPVRELEKGYYFNTDFIPKGWSDNFYMKIYKFRPMIEQGNASKNTYYNSSRLNTRGEESAIKDRAIIYILELLKALTAYKIGRPDLVMKPTAFESSKQIQWREMIPQLVELNGYKILSNWL